MVIVSTTAPRGYHSIIEEEITCVWDIMRRIRNRCLSVGVALWAD
jgi:hypothetical protein